jgi:hypothetical protein
MHIEYVEKKESAESNTRRFGYDIQTRTITNDGNTNAKAVLTKGQINSNVTIDQRLKSSLDGPGPPKNILLCPIESSSSFIATA